MKVKLTQGVAPMNRAVTIVIAIMALTLLASAAFGQFAVGGVYYASPFSILTFGGATGYGGGVLGPPVASVPLPVALPPRTPSTYYVVSNGYLLQYDWNYNLIGQTPLPPYVPWPQGGTTLADVRQAGVDRWSAQLSGLQSEGYTEASGSACFSLDASGQELNYRVTVVNLLNPGEVSINLNDQNLPPEAAPAVARLLCCRTYGGRFTGVIAQGTIRDRDLVGWLAGYGISDLVQGLNQGQAFVSVRTVQHPQGELMGTIRTQLPTALAQAAGPSCQ